MLMKYLADLCGYARSFAPAVLTSVLLLSLSGQAWSFGLMVQPSTIELKTSVASQHRQTIQVRNMRPDRTLTLTVGESDWILDENGKLQLFAPSTQPRSAAGWLQFSPATLTLKPGETQQIVVDVSIPAGVEQDGDHRVALLISTLLPQARESGSAVWNRYQVASLFYVAVGDSVSQPVVERSWFRIDDDGVPVLMTKIRNNGNTHARLTGSIVFKDRTGGAVHRQEFKAVVLDHQTVVVETRISGAQRLPSSVPFDVELDLENTVNTSVSAAPEAVVIDQPPEPFRLDYLTQQPVALPSAQ